MQDRFEALPEVSKADIVGAPEREIQVNVDKIRMDAAGVTFNDIANSIANENRDISAGNIKIGETQPTIQVKGQFRSAYDMEDLVVKSIYGNSVYLRDIAQIVDTAKERESYSRLGNKNVVTLQIIKRAGENLINTADKINGLVKEMKEKQEKAMAMFSEGQHQETAEQTMTS